MDIFSVTLTANERLKITSYGRYFQLIETGAPLDVTFERHNSPNGEVGRSVEAGFVREPGDWQDESQAFHAVVLTSTTNQNVKIGISEFKGDYRRVVGIVSVESANDGATVADQTVGAVAVTIAAANASRRGAVIVQNVAAAGGGNVRVALGVTATATTGVQLAPGQSVTFHSTASVSAIREGAVSADVSVTEETRS